MVKSGEQFVSEESEGKPDDVEKSKAMLDAFELNFQEVIPEIFIDEIPLSALAALGVTDVKDLHSMGMELTHDLVKTYLLMRKISDDSFGEYAELGKTIDFNSYDVNDTEYTQHLGDVRAKQQDILDHAQEQERVLQDGFYRRKETANFMQRFLRTESLGNN